MSKPIICLWGRHKHRIIFSYYSYQVLCKDYCTFTEDPLKADFLIAGFSSDFFDQAEYISKILIKNKNVSLVVLSEEPLWDTVYSPSLEMKTQDSLYRLKEFSDIKYFRIDHENSSIFEYNFLPYYLTADTTIFSHLIPLFVSAAKDVAHRDMVISKWRKGLNLFAACEYRPSALANITHYDQANLVELSELRTCVILELMKSSLVETDVIGKGWIHCNNGKNRRQILSDWHLDKIMRLKRGYTYCVSLENTLSHNYVSEKLFDAYASLSIPIYYADPTHSVFSKLGISGFCNLYPRNGNGLVEKLNSLAELDFEHMYELFSSDVYKLLNIFMLPDLLYDECKCRLNRLFRLLATFKSY